MPFQALLRALASTMQSRRQSVSLSMVVTGSLLTGLPSASSVVVTLLVVTCGCRGSRSREIASRPD